MGGPVSSTTTILQINKQHHGEEVFLTVVILPNRQWDPSGTPQPHNQPGHFPPTRPSPWPTCTSNSCPILFPAQLSSKPAVPCTFPFPLALQQQLTDVYRSTWYSRVMSPPHSKIVKPLLLYSSFGYGSPQEGANTSAPQGATGSHNRTQHPFPIHFLMAQRCCKHLSYFFIL